MSSATTHGDADSVFAPSSFTCIGISMEPSRLRVTSIVASFEPSDATSTRFFFKSTRMSFASVDARRMGPRAVAASVTFSELTFTSPAMGSRDAMSASIRSTCAEPPSSGAVTFKSRNATVPATSTDGSLPAACVKRIESFAPSLPESIFTGSGDGKYST